jgi:aryl-alcohol dehydrogenase-like predicted oxidoreductase
MSDASKLGAARRELGHGGPQVSMVGVGANNFGRRLDYEGAERVVHAALDLGINLFDTADTYGGGESERFLGKALVGRRDQALIATKFGSPMPGSDPAAHRGSAEYLRAEAEASLSRLQVEAIDLYQMHEPDPSTPIAETLGALHELVVAGKVRWIGISNFSASQAEDAQQTARQMGLTAVVSSQDEYSLLNRKIEQELIPAIEHLGIGLLPYFPLASGLLTGKYRRGEPAPAGSRLAQPASQDRLSDQSKFDVIEALEGFAKERGISLLTVAIGSLLARPVVASVIAGAMSPEQVAANFAAADWVVTEEDWQQLDQITSPRSKAEA